MSREPVSEKNNRIIDSAKYACDIAVCTLAWAGDHAAREDEAATGLLHSRIVVNGQELPYAMGIRIHAQGSDFTFAEIAVNPTAIRFVALDNETFRLDELPNLDDLLSKA